MEFQPGEDAQVNFGQGAPIEEGPAVQPINRTWRCCMLVHPSGAILRDALANLFDRPLL